ncbi:hypothetical protein GCM10027342_43630 [Photobacterium alginatilyticum]
MIDQSGASWSITIKKGRLFAFLHYVVNIAVGLVAEVIKLERLV